MKRSRLFLLAYVLPVWGMLQAQTSYEASALLDTDLRGTARYVGMGGAMSALGADMSTMSTNPAGTALYRSWDVAFSYGGNWYTQFAQSASARNRSFGSFGALDNTGFVVANKKSNTDLLRFVNFGFNYRTVTRFDGKMSMSSNLGGLSQTGQMAWQAWQNVGNVDYTYFDPTSDHNLYGYNYFKNANYGWMTLMGAYADLMGIYAETDAEGNLLRDEQGNVVENYWYTASDACNYTERVSGGINACDFNLSFNLSDAVYLGVTFTTYNVDRNVESTYSERFYGGDYVLKNFYRTVGRGYDFKFGAIVRPFSESSFRVGLSATTRPVYNLRDYNSAIISSQFVEGGGWELDTQSDDAFGGDCYTDYTMVAPAKFNVSLGGTIGRSWALGAEYEYTDYGNITLYNEYGSDDIAMNEHTASNFAGLHTLRLGVEKTFGTFYTRAGYNCQAGGYRRDAWKMIPINSVQTNTAYSNLKSTANYTCGVGFRGDAVYADFALLYSVRHADFYPFDDTELKATALTRNLFKGMATVGIRF